MKWSNFRIGGVWVDIGCSKKFYPDERFSAFQKNPSGKHSPDIQFKLTAIANDSPVLPLFDSKEKLKFSSLSFLPMAGSNLQIFPVKKIAWNDPKLKKYRFESLDILDAPILRSRKILSIIEKSLDHANQAVIIGHTFTVELRDFQTHQVLMYYPEEIGHLLDPISVAEGIRAGMAMLLVDFSALLLHCSAVLRKGRVAVFFAPDEGGKSTAASLSPGNRILNDDRNIIRRTNSKFKVFSTPWGQKSSGDIHGDLGGLFILEKSDSFQLIPLDPKQIVKYLWEEHLHFFSSLPKKQKIKTFELLVSISRSVPVYFMKFNRDFIDWKQIDEIIHRQ